MSKRPQSADQDNRSVSLGIPPDVPFSPSAKSSQRGLNGVRGSDMDLQSLDPDLAGILTSRPSAPMRGPRQKPAPPPLSEASSSRTPLLTPEQVRLIFPF
jgi:hypothetical protein